MSSTDLDAGYAECARLTRAYGTTYYWGTALLPAPQRRHVYAVYALCRLADDIVDADGATAGEVAATASALARFRAGFDAAIAGNPPDAVLAAIARTVREAGIGTYQIFQETYHRPTDERVHPGGTRKGDFLWRLDAMGRARPLEPGDPCSRGATQADDGEFAGHAG